MKPELTIWQEYGKFISVKRGKRLIEVTVNGETIKLDHNEWETVLNFERAYQYTKGNSNGLSQGQDKGRAESSGKGLPGGVAGAGEEAC